MSTGSQTRFSSTIPSHVTVSPTTVARPGRDTGKSEIRSVGKEPAAPPLATRGASAVRDEADGGRDAGQRPEAKPVTAESETTARGETEAGSERKGQLSCGGANEQTTQPIQSDSSKGGMREMQAHYPTPEVERRLKADERSRRSGLGGERSVSKRREAGKKGTWEMQEDGSKKRMQLAVDAGLSGRNASRERKREERKARVCDIVDDAKEREDVGKDQRRGGTIGMQERKCTKICVLLRSGEKWRSGKARSAKQGSDGVLGRLAKGGEREGGRSGDMATDRCGGEVTVKKRLFGDVSMPGRRRLQLLKRAKFCPSDSESGDLESRRTNIAGAVAEFVLNDKSRSRGPNGLGADAWRVEGSARGRGAGSAGSGERGGERGAGSGERGAGSGERERGAGATAGESRGSSERGAGAKLCLGCERQAAERPMIRGIGKGLKKNEGGERQGEATAGRNSKSLGRRRGAHGPRIEPERV
ncbi:hypothetical protein C8J57DRAFT_1231527 [Mycena rebaudengoi]|nr:hypothetical protein C8J57DRAFT_1231527 [Mycena rebaudengoi]